MGGLHIGPQSCFLVTALKAFLRLFFRDGSLLRIENFIDAAQNFVIFWGLDHYVKKD